jgi:hypothetical protein
MKRPSRHHRQYVQFCIVIAFAFLLSSFVQPAVAQTGTPNDNPTPIPNHNSAIINNGTIQMGINDEGHLNVGGGSLSAGSSGTTVVGLRYMPTNGEATAPGCLCEGWGAADARSGVTGYANIAVDGVQNMSLVLFSATASAATSVVNIQNTMVVTHTYHPSALTPYLYQADVSIQNVSSAEIDLRYRRVMDWDIQPDTFDEYVTIQGTATSAAVLYASNNGFETANPLGNRTDLGSTGDFVDAGPKDHGALFDFGLGLVQPNEFRHFTIFYGAAGNETDALAALTTVGAAIYSLGQPKVDPTGGTPNTYMFAFSGVDEDSDGDGLPNSWEENGVSIDPDAGGPLGPQFIDLPAMGADAQKPDIFLQIDWMADSTHTHKLDATAIKTVVDAFANSPYTSPTGSVGINLHVDQGSDSIMNYATNQTWGSLSRARALPHVNNLGTSSGGSYSWTDFAASKDTNTTAGVDGFTETGRSAVFHYVISAHNYGGGTSSGISRGIGASDLIVSLGSFDGGVGTVNQQAGTLMHELGHNLNLRHGGGDDVNFKPNYLSVMNYAFQLDGVIKGGTAGSFDYSHSALGNLDEVALDEPAGLGAGAAGYGTRRYCAGVGFSPVPDASSAIDWNCDGDATDVALSYDVNNSGGSSDVLAGYDDWSNVKFKVGAIGLAGISAILPTATEDESLTPALAEIILPLTRYHFSGFFPPINNPPAVNTVNSGSTVPVKFSLGGDQGRDIFANGYPASQRIDCATQAAVGALVPTNSSSGLSYDARADQYTYTWKTDKAWKNTCRRFVVRFNDGSTAQTANFNFNK